MKYVDRHENVWWEKLNGADLFLDLEDQYMKILHNNAKLISSVMMCNLLMDVHTLLPLACYILSETYDLHVALQYFNMSQINIGHLIRPSFLCITYFIFKFSLKMLTLL